MTTIISIAFISYLFLGMLWLLSLKEKILAKHGRHLTNSDIKALAKAGDELAGRLARRTNVFLGVGAVLAILIAVVR